MRFSYYFAKCRWGVALLFALSVPIGLAHAAAAKLDEQAVVFEERAEDAELVRSLRAIPDGTFAAKTYRATAVQPMPYRLYTPKPAPKAAIPLVLVLHGSNAIGRDNVTQLGGFAKSWASPTIAPRFPAYVLVPQVAKRSSSYEKDADGRLASTAGDSLASVLALVDELVDRLRVDRARIYVVGFSMGASAALDAVVLRPDFFAGVVAFAPVPPPRAAIAGMGRTPIAIVHGTRDEENDFANAYGWAEAAAAAGKPVRFVRYTGMDHRVPTDALVGSEWRTWLFAKRR